jgi:diguanylate cyclase (GGDEF)-like protein
MNAFIGDIAKNITCISPGKTCESVDLLFNEDPSLQGVVVIEEQRPTGLITKMKFYQKMGTRYGYNLYMRRPIELLANNKPLIVDYYTSVIEVSKLAMNRAAEELYDYIIVIQNDMFCGVVSIRSLLIRVADIQIELASYLNPLTRLPGNNIINEKLNDTFEEKGDFSVLYIDLDRFKAYNDVYGFNKGDEILRITAKILSQNLSDKDGFLGHIGGDDFIVILNHHDYINYCTQVITEFDEKIKHFYSEEHLKQKFIYTENRDGRMEKIPLITISIAVVTNLMAQFNSADDIVNEATRIKKVCKLKSGSCFHAEPAYCC